MGMVDDIALLAFKTANLVFLHNVLGIMDNKSNE